MTYVLVSNKIKIGDMQGHFVLNKNARNVLLCIAVAICLAYLPLKFAYNFYELKYNYNYTTGKIIEKASDGAGNPTIDYIYEVGDTRYTGITLVDNRYSVKVGESYPVRYSNSHPSISRMEFK